MSYNNECPICLNAVSNKEQCSLSCGHVYHTICFKTWVLKQRMNHVLNPGCCLCKDKSNFLQHKYKHETGKVFDLGIIEDKWKNWCVVYSYDPESGDFYYAGQEKSRKDMFSNEITSVFNPNTNERYEGNLQKRLKNIVNP